MMVSQMQEHEDDELSYRRNIHGAASGGEEVAPGREFKWVREYKFASQPLGNESFLFTWDKDQRSSQFFNVVNQIEVKRVKRRRTMAFGDGDPGTASVVVESRDETELEQFKARDLRRLAGASRGKRCGDRYWAHLVDMS